MPPISPGSAARFDFKASPLGSNAPSDDGTRGGGKVVRWCAIVLSAASLAACAQSPTASKRSGIFSPTRQAAFENSRPVWFAPGSRLASAPTARAPASGDATRGAHTYSQGLASFYTEGTQTANGERFDTNAMTAAHRTLPFGTQLRVTSVTTGRSVTVRINDRGPFIKGRVVDLSLSAAKALGMVNAGVANVKLDIVRLPKRRVRNVPTQTGLIVPAKRAPSLPRGV